MKRNFSIFLVLSLLVFSMSQSDNIFLVEGDSEIQVNHGEEFSIKIKGDPTSGFSWLLLNKNEVSECIKATNLRDSNSGIYSVRGETNSNGFFIFKFKAEKYCRKIYELQFSNLKSWEIERNYYYPEIIVRIKVN